MSKRSCTEAPAESSRPTKKPLTKSQAHPSPEPMTLDSISSGILRTKTLSLLRTVPTLSVQKAYSTLISFNDNVEVAAWHVLDEQSSDPTTAAGLKLNEFIDVDTRLRVLRLRQVFSGNTLQECYVAIKVANGVFDDAVKHLRWMSEKKVGSEEKGAREVGFMGKGSWMDSVRY